MENLKDLYKELAEKIKTEINTIKWVDLWHNQVNFLEEEHPFPAPAVFISMIANGMEDIGNNIQQFDMQMDFFLFYETFLDSFEGAYNQAGALSFLDNLTKLHQLLHGSSGDNYSEMRRIAFTAVDTGSAQNLYKMSYMCLVTDSSAQGETEAVHEDTDMVIEDAPQPEPVEDDGALFVI
jgi:hypothetical protein